MWWAGLHSWHRSIGLDYTLDTAVLGCVTPLAQQCWAWVHPWHSNVELGYTPETAVFGRLTLLTPQCWAGFFLTQQHTPSTAVLCCVKLLTQQWCAGLHSWHSCAVQVCTPNTAVLSYTPDTAVFQAGSHSWHSLVYLVYFEGEKTFSVYGRPLFEAWRKVSWIRDGILLNIIQLRNLGILVKI